MGNKTARLREEATLGKIDGITTTVFISDVHAIINPKRRGRIYKLKISHILTASRRNAAADRPLPGVKHDFLCIRDTLDENLLASGLLARGLKIIDEADSRGERILVHWWVELSAWLSSLPRRVLYSCAPVQWSRHLSKRHPRLRASDEEAQVERRDRTGPHRDKRPAAEPNESFLCQLGIFEKCNYNAEPSTIVKSPAYLDSLPALMKFGAVPPQ